MERHDATNCGRLSTREDDDDDEHDRDYDDEEYNGDTTSTEKYAHES